MAGIWLIMLARMYATEPWCSGVKSVCELPTRLSRVWLLTYHPCSPPGKMRRLVQDKESQIDFFSRYFLIPKKGTLALKSILKFIIFFQGWTVSQ